VVGLGHVLFGCIVERRRCRSIVDLRAVFSQVGDFRKALPQGFTVGGSDREELEPTLCGPLVTQYLAQV
jgi:hypothetical protein